MNRVILGVMSGMFAAGFAASVGATDLNGQPESSLLFAGDFGLFGGASSWSGSCHLS